MGQKIEFERIKWRKISSYEEKRLAKFIESYNGFFTEETVNSISDELKDLRSREVRFLIFPYIAIAFLYISLRSTNIDGAIFGLDLNLIPKLKEFILFSVVGMGFISIRYIYRGKYLRRVIRAYSLALTNHDEEKNEDRKLFYRIFAPDNFDINQSKWPVTSEEQIHSSAVFLSMFLLILPLAALVFVATYTYAYV